MKINLYRNLFEWHLLRIGVNGTNVVYNYSFFNMTFLVFDKNANWYVRRAFKII